MEQVVAIISLIWVIGLFSLQRIDNLINEFYSGIAYYLSLHSGVIDKIQLEVITLLPKPGIDSYLNSLIEAGDRTDKKALQNGKNFLNLSKKIKRALEILLVVVTLVMPIIYYVDFSNLNTITSLDKSFGLYLALAMVALSSIIIERVLSHLSDLNWPIRIDIKPSSK